MTCSLFKRHVFPLDRMLSGPGRSRCRPLAVPTVHFQHHYRSQPPRYSNAVRCHGTFDDKSLAILPVLGPVGGVTSQPRVSVGLILSHENRSDYPMQDFAVATASAD